jgi:hypothetical protein
VRKPQRDAANITRGGHAADVSGRSGRGNPRALAGEAFRGDMMCK